MTMKKFSLNDGVSISGDITDEDTGEIISIGDDDFIVNGKHIQAGFGLWLREDSQGDKLYGFDVTTDGQLDFYIENGVEASLTATALSVSGSTVATSDNSLTFTNKSGNISQWTNDSNYLTSIPAEYLTQTEGDARYLQSFTETNNLSVAVTWANVPDANITQSSVTQHQAALSINATQDVLSVSTETTSTLTSSSFNKVVECTGNVTLPSPSAQKFILISPEGSARTITRPGTGAMYIDNTNSATGTTGTRNLVMCYSDGTDWFLSGNVS